MVLESLTNNIKRRDTFLFFILGEKHNDLAKMERYKAFHAGIINVVKLLCYSYIVRYHIHIRVRIF